MKKCFGCSEESIQGDGSFGKRKGGFVSITFTWRSGWCLFNCLKFFKATYHMVGDSRVVSMRLAF